MGPHLADQEGVVGTKPPGQGLAEGGELGPQLAAPAPRAPPGRLCRGRAPRALPGPTPQDVVGDGGQLDAGDAHAGHHAVPMHIQPPAPLDQPLPAHPSSGRVAGAGRSFVCTILLVGLVAPLRGSESSHANFSPDSRYQKPTASARHRRAARIADLHAAGGRPPMTISVGFTQMP